MRSSTSKIGWISTLCFCCVTVALLAWVKAEAASSAAGKLVHVKIVGAQAASGRTQLAYSTNSQTIQKLALQDGAVSLNVTGRKLVLYVDDATAGSETLRIALPESPQVAVTIHVDGKIRADVSPATGKSVEPSSASATKSLAPTANSAGGKARRPISLSTKTDVSSGGMTHGAARNPRSLSSHNDTTTGSTHIGTVTGLSASHDESAGFMASRSYRTAKLRNQDAPRGGCPVVCPPGATVENEPDCGLPADTVNGGCNSIPPVFSSISCGETVCGTGAFDGSTRDTDWYKLVLTQDTNVTFSGQADFDLLIGIVNNFGVDSCSGVSAFLAFGTGAACTPASASACLSAGTWYLFVAPDFTVPVACGAGYTATVTCSAGDCGGGGGVCGPPNPNDCNSANSTPGCSDQACCELVCAADPFCCQTAWDSICASEAAQMCGGGGSVCGPPNTNDCNSANSTPGCSDQACCETVCAADPFCCQTAWDSICASEAAQMCGGGGPCDVVCDPNATPENEPDCGLPVDTVNGGCNSIPPVFSPIACGQTYCGTGAFDGSTRDTDWYELILTQQTNVTWTVRAEFDVVVGIVDNQGGALDCSQVSAFLVSAVGAPCQDTSVTACLSAGRWWLFAAPDFTVPVTCGAEYTATVTCGDCPVGPPNDDCQGAIALTLPADVTGSTVGANPDAPPAFTCGGFGVTAPGVWYTVVGDGNTLTASLCNPGTNYDTKLFAYCGTCTQLFCVAGDDDFCGYPPGYSQVSWCSAPGTTYYLLVSGYSGVGDFELTVTSDGFPCSSPPSCEPCAITCDPNATPENEPDCGLPVDTVNGGCNSSPPVFSPIVCGQTYCGTAAFDGSTRDTDWYELILTQRTNVTWTVRASFDVVVGIVDNQGGALDCSQVSAFLVVNVGGPCQDISVTSCLAAGHWWLFVAPDFTNPVGCGALYTATVTCGECPAGPPNDDCDGAIALTIPADVNGTTIGANPDAPPAFTCGGFGITAPGVWYTVVGDGTTLTASLCNPGTSYDTKLFAYCGTCTQLFCVAGDDDFCGYPPGYSQVSWCSAPGNTYYLLVSGYSGVGNFELTVTSDSLTCNNPPSCEPCVVTCAPGKTDENEPDCGLPVDTVNGGCNSSPPVFSPIVCGQSYCGTAAFDGSTRDTDWYELTLTQNTQVTWTVEAEFDVVVGIVDNGGGTLDCSQVTSFLVVAVGTPCQSTSVTACLSAGTWWMFVAPDFTSPVACGAVYNASLTCAECPAGPPNDECDGAEMILCNSTTNTDTTLATNNASDPAYSCHFGGPAQGVGTLWYTFVATNSSARLSTCGSAATDTLLAVYSGTCGSLTEIACNDDLPCGPTTFLSQVCVTGLTVGTTYYVQVSSYSNADRGPITLDLACPCPGFEPTGACCVDGVCSVTTQSNCAGDYLGDGTDCNSSGGPPTVYVSDPNLAIPDADPIGVSDTINVPDSYTIGDVNVDLVINHTWVGDLCVSLTHGSTTVALIEKPGSASPAGCYDGSPFGCSNDNYNIILDDQGTGGTIEALCAASMVSPPNYVPNNPLAAFNGADAAGPWILSVSDHGGGDIGTLVHWSLHIGQPGQSPCNIEPCDDCPAGTIPIVDSDGDNSGWCVSASDPANVVIHVEDVDRTAGTASLHIDKNYVNPPGFGGLIPCILLDFVQVCPDVRTVDTILINGETISNNTGVAWHDFHWVLFDGPEAWFDVVASDGFDTTPFLSKLFGGFLDSPTNNQAKSLDAYNGTVPAGGTFSPTGGAVSSGPPVDVVVNPNLSIPDNVPAGVSSSVTVADSVTISDLNVDLVVTHTWVGDLIVTLTHGSTSVTLIDRPGVPASTFGCSNDNYNIILDDEGAGGSIEALCSASMVSPPNYVPNNPLSAFDGANSSGMWTISISDNAGGDLGTLVQWSLHITPQAQNTGEPLTIGVDLSGPPVSFTLKECPTTTGQVHAGACCIGLDCSILSPVDCANSYGLYKGDGTVCTAQTCLPPNDECNNCISVQTGVTYNGSTLGATGTDISSCAFNDNLDVWHCWTATCTGPATFGLCGSAFDTTLAVYAGCGGAQLACNDDDIGGCSPQSKLTLSVVTGQTYYIRVAGFNGDAGNYSLTVTCAAQSKGRGHATVVLPN